MKFAHMADCHIGSWRDPKLKDTSTLAFVKGVDKCIKEKVDFIIIAGDLFNTSFPRLDNLKVVVSKFKQLKDLDITVYIVPGSHDYSPSGKTILDVLEEAGLFVNVFKGTVENGKLKLKFTIDKKTGAKITGMLGKKGTLERAYYEKLDVENLEKEDGYKIFVFHSGIDELKPKEMENIITQPLSLLPKGFDYYAGGHVHIVDDKQIEGYGKIAYPGPLFPNSFAELEKLERGGFYIVEDSNLMWEPIQIYNIEKMHIDCNNLSPDEIRDRIIDKIKNKELNNTIALIRLFGTLASGKPSDIDFREIFSRIYEKSAYFVMKSSHAVVSKEFEEVRTDARNVEDIESFLVKEHLGQIKINGLTLEKEEAMIKDLMRTLSAEKQEGETVPDFEKRVKSDISEILEMEL
ncbi:exonuclease SbcCD subunit D [Candidatus Woesearchaeota archaeon]|nr:exonuclease SbcCD subunit D [Candidatus Woesearchaeota archaeon]